MACHWTFTLSYMSPFCIFTKCFIPIQDEMLGVHSVFEGISKFLMDLLSLVLQVFQNMCYDTFILPSIISFLVRRIHMMNLQMYLHPAVLSSLSENLWPQYSVLQNPTTRFNKRTASFSTKIFFLQVSAIERQLA